jgi:hypothetical protein
VQEAGAHIGRQRQQFGFGLGYQLNMPRHQFISFLLCLHITGWPPAIPAGSAAA